MRSAGAVLVVTATGLVVLLAGAWLANPLTFRWTAEDYHREPTGRRLLVIATIVLLVAGGLVAARGSWLRGLLVALPGVACTALAYAFPRGVLAPLAFVPLAGLALWAAARG